MTSKIIPTEERKKRIQELEEDLQERTVILKDQQQDIDLMTLYFSFAMARKRADFAIPSMTMLLVLLLSFELIAHPLFRFIMPIFFAISFWSVLALFVGRFRDLGLRKIFLFFLLIPVLNVVFYLYLLFKPSKN